MSKQGMIGDLLRQRLRDERERRGWSQAQVAAALNQRINGGYVASSVAKAEAGTRAVRGDELIALADIFGISTDALAGRGSGGTDSLWAASKLAANAQRMAAEVSGLHSRLADDFTDLAYYSERDQRKKAASGLVEATLGAMDAALEFEAQLRKVAGEFPLPGRG